MKCLASIAISVIMLAAVTIPTMAVTMTDKTLMAWVKVADPEQKGSGILSIERSGQFDAIVYGENTPHKWMAGSDNWSRTQPDQSAAVAEQPKSEAIVQIAIVYQGNQVTIYRNGTLYASYAIQMPLEFSSSDLVLLGKRHQQASGTPFWSGNIYDARIYAVPLSVNQIAQQRIGALNGPKPAAWWCFMDGKTADQMGTYSYAKLYGGARVKDGALVLNGKGAYMEAHKNTPQHPRITSTIMFRPKEPAIVADPIPFYWKGEYHVFYLRAGDKPRQPWEHIVSKDLIHWKELPAALVPGDDKTGPDYEGIWTGSVIEHDGLFHIFYTGKNSGDPLGDQKVMHAVSTDLIKWKKLPEYTFYADGRIYWSKPVNGAIDQYQPYHHQAFRDPEVFWDKANNRWSMILHACTATEPKGVIGCYSSDDLYHWTPQPVLIKTESSFDCPHIFQSNGRWFVISAGLVYTSADQAVGSYAAALKPFGAGLLEVPKGCDDGKRHIIWGWMWDHQYFTDEGAGTWGGTLSMAREIYAAQDGSLRQRPVQEVINYFNKPVAKIKPELTVPTKLKVPKDYMMHFNAQLAADSTLSVRFREQAGATESGYLLTVNPQSGVIELKNKYGKSARFVADLNPSQPVDVRVFVIGDIIECFINDSYAVSLHAYDYKSGLLDISWNGAGTVSALMVTTPK